MTQNFRLESGGLINRSKKISFKFNGKNYFGYEGDTLASALIANGVHLIGRSFKYHRPRGFFGAGVDEPYAIVQLYRNGETEPNIKATEQELFEGLEACQRSSTSPHERARGRVRTARWPTAYSPAASD